MNKKISEKNKLFFIGLIAALTISTIDIYSKRQVFAILDKVAIEENLPYPEIKITGFLKLVKVWNSGVSFGMLSNLNNGKYIIATLNVAIMLILLIWLYQNKHKYITAALALIIGGAIGNLVDRMQNDAVADFLDFSFSSYHWPAFNVADSAVFIGVAMLLLEGFFIKKLIKKDEK